MARTPAINFFIASPLLLYPYGITTLNMALVGPFFIAPDSQRTAKYTHFPRSSSSNFSSSGLRVAKSE
jgi:hypothetical protein